MPMGMAICDDQRDHERATGVAGALQAARIGQCDGDEEAGHAEIPQQLAADHHDHGIVEAEEPQQLIRGDEKDDADAAGNHQSIAARQSAPP